MAKFRYIIGGLKPETEGLAYGEIENVQSYQLIKKGANGSETVLATKHKHTHAIGAPLDGSRVIIGGIGKEGKPAEIQNSLIMDTADGRLFTPIARLEQEGYVYYLRFDGEMRVWSNSAGWITKVPYNGFKYFSSQEKVTGIKVNGTMKVKTDGFYLDFSYKVGKETVSEEVKVYDAIIDTTVITQAEMTTTPYVYSTSDDYHRTEYIPIGFLADGHNGYCFGAITTDAYSYYGTMYKIAFYDENLSFCGGLTYKDLPKDDKGVTKKYLTRSEIFNLKSSFEVDKTVEFVVFSSYRVDASDSDTLDVVSIDRIYFPLFDPVYDLSEGDVLFVRAKADGLFHRDCDSEELVYTTTEEN